MTPVDTVLPTLLLPAMQCTPLLFAAQLPLLWKYGAVMVADTTRADDIRTLAAQVLAQAPPVFRLLGLSMGGYLAFEIYRQAPQRVQGLVLCNTSARADTPDKARQRQRLLRLAELRGFVPHFDPALVAPALADDATLHARCNAMAREVGRAAFIRQQKVVQSRPDSRSGLAAIACRTLVIGGAHDPLTPPVLLQEIAEGIPHAELVILPDAGHLPTLETPDSFNEVLARWLDAAAVPPMAAEHAS